ncbi:MAG: sensor histidine kinase [Acidimicrobiales bacterium]
MTTDIRIRVAAVAAIATVVLLSVVSALGFVALVNVTRQSQLDQLNERLDGLERQLVAGDAEVSARLRLDFSLRVIRPGDAPPPAPQVGTLQVVRTVDRPEVVAIVGRVSTRQIDQTLATVRTGLWISVLVIGLLVGAAAWLVVDRALSPVRRLTEEVKAIEANQSKRLLPVTASGDEIAELASTFNAMLTKLRAADSDRRRFVSDASHELRTPLMVLSADAEYALDHGGDTTKLAESVLSQSDRLSTLVDDLLTLASIDEGQTATAEVRTVGEILAEVADGLLSADLDPVALSVPIADVTRSIANIVANAKRHARSRVEVGLTTAEGWAVITVDDDGPGIPADQRVDIFKRFYRPDTGRARVDGGAGLGLAIARAELTQAGGTVAVDDGPLGGARFSITVPIAGPTGATEATDATDATARGETV